VGLQWLYSGSTVALQRTKDEGMTNKRRIYDEGKANLRWRNEGYLSVFRFGYFELL